MEDSLLATIVLPIALAVIMLSLGLSLTTADFKRVLVVPKGEYVSMVDFVADASTEEVAGFFRAVGRVAEDLGLMERGYRLLSNHGADAHQEVPHLHVHLFGGAPLGPMLKRVAG